MHGFPSTLQSLRGIFKRKKRSVAGNGKYSVVSHSKRGRKRGGYANRGYPKVNPAKQFAAKNSAYNSSSRFQRELITHAEMRNILPQRILTPAPKFMHINRNEAHRRAPQDLNPRKKPQERSNYQDGAVSWGDKIGKMNASESTILNDTSIASQLTSASEPRSISASSDRLHRTLPNSTSRDSSDLLRESRGIAHTATAAVFNNSDENSSTNANGRDKGGAKIIRAVLQAPQRGNIDSNLTKHSETGGNSYPAGLIEDPTYHVTASADAMTDIVTGPVTGYPPQRFRRNMIPQSASKSQRAVSQLLIAEESRRDKSRAQPKISGRGPDGGLRNSVADYHQINDFVIK